MPSSRVSSYYDEYWSTRGFSPVGHKAHGTLLAMLEQNVHPTDSVLDVGCGDGSKVGHFCEGRSASYRGVDVSEQAVELARKRGFKAQVIEDASALPFDDGTFDVVVCCEVLEHLCAPLEGATEARRVLRTGGRYMLRPQTSLTGAVDSIWPFFVVGIPVGMTGPSKSRGAILTSASSLRGACRQCSNPPASPLSPREAFTTRISSFGCRRFVGSAGAAKLGD